MKLQDIVYKSGYTQDGWLKPYQGRIVIYEDKVEISHGNSPDHLYLLHALASRYGFKRDFVISDGIRLYYTIENNVMIVSQGRKIDEDMLMPRLIHYGQLIFKRATSKV